MPSRRVRIAAIVAVLLIAAIVFLPRTPWVRDWALQRVQTALSDQGYALDYDRSAGNLWSEVRLTGVGLAGPGVDLSVERIRVGYFLPSLLASELPISVDIVGIDGRIDLGDLPAAGTGGGAVGIRPVFEQVAVREVSVAVDDIPFTIPDVTFTELDLAQSNGRFAFATELRTAEGSLRAEGDLGLAPFALDARVQSADLAIARHWWNGITGGTARGTVRIDEAGIRADMEVSDGSLAWLGLDVTEIAGPVRYQHPTVEGELRGLALGGPTRANARVEIGARRWQGDVDGSAQLPQIARWLARSTTFDTQALDLSGDATYEFSAAGWTSVTLEGDAQGSGTLLGRPLQELAADIRFTSEAGLKVDALTAFADGTVRATVATARDGLRIEGAASGMELGVAMVPDAGLDLRFTADGPVGTGTASVRSRLAGQNVVAELDLTADPEGWQLFADGSVGGGALTGATVLSDGVLEGGVRLAELDLPWWTGDPVITTAWEGPLASLAITAELDGDQPVRLEAGGVRIDDDLRGAVRGTLENGTTWDVTGAFGPVSVNATGDPQTGGVELASSPVGLLGRVETTVTIPDAAIRYGPGGASFDARIEHETLVATGLTLLPAVWNAEGVLAPTFRVEAATEAGTATLRWTPPTLAADLDGLEAVIAGREASLDGSVALAPAEGLASLTADLRALVAEGEIALTAEPGPALTARLPAGFRAGPVQLAAPLALDGAIDAGTGRLQLTGSVGAVTLDVDAGLDPAPRASVVVRSGGETATMRFGDDVGFEAVGRLRLGPVARALGLELDGLLRADLRSTEGAYEGTAVLELERPVVLRAGFEGQGSTIVADLTGTLAGQEIDVRGTIVPSIDLLGRVGPLEGMVLAGDALGGSGRLPAFSIGPARIPDLGWELRGSVPDQRLDLSVGDSRATLRWEEGWRVDVDVALPMQIGALDADVLARASLDSANPRGTIEGSLQVVSTSIEGPSTIASFTGDRDAVAIVVEAPADLLLDVFTNAQTLQGDVSLTGRFDVDALSLRASGAWRAGDTVANLSLAAGGDQPLQVTLDADEVSASWSDGALTVGGVGGDVAPFLSPALLGRLPFDDVRLRGRLQRAGGVWDGSLEVDSDGLERPLVLEGAADTLRVSYDGSAGGADIRLRGTLLPAPDLTVEATAGPAALSATVSGPWSAPNLAGRLTVEPLTAGPVAVDPVAATLEGRLVPFDLALRGEGLDLEVSAEGWSGRGRLSGSVSSQAQQATFQIAGPLAAPVVDVAFEGPVDGAMTAGTSGASGVLDLMPSALGASGFLDTPVRATLTGRPDLSWEVELTTSAPVAGERVAVSVAIAGERIDYRGTGRVSTSGGTIAGLVLSGTGADMELSVDVDALAPAALQGWLPAAEGVRGTGTLTLRTEPTEIEGDVAIAATVGGEPLDVRASLPDTGGLELEAMLGTTVLSVAADDPTSAAFTVASSGTLSASVTGGVRIDRGNGLVVDVETRGSVAGERIDVDATYRANPGVAGDAEGAVQIAIASTLADARIALQRPDADDGGRPWSVQLDLERLAGAVAGRATLSGALDWTDPRGIALDLAGAVDLLQPDLRLDVRLAATPGDVAVAVASEGLVARGSLGADAAQGEPASWSFEITGAGAFDMGALALAIDAAEPFTWTPDEGFGGRLSATIDAGVLQRANVGPVAVELRGERALRVVVDAPEDLFRGEIVLDPEPWRVRAIQGALEFAVPARTPTEWGVAQDGDASLGPNAYLPGLEADLEVAGTWSAPEIGGPVRLTGPVRATGSLRWIDGAARVDLEGEALELLATADGSGWNVEATLVDVPLPILPLAAAVATGEVRADGAWSGSPRVTVTEGRVQTTAGTIGVEGSVEDDIAVALRLDMPLEDLEIGPDARGRITGPVVIRADSLEAWRTADVQSSLDVVGLGWGEVRGSLSGTVNVAGPVDALEAFIRLRGGDGATGAVEATIDVAAGIWDVETTLSIGDVGTDATVRIGPETVSATGAVRWRDAGLILGSAESSLWLRGDGVLAGWNGTLHRDGWVIALEGPAGPIVRSSVPWLGQVAGHARLRAELESEVSVDLQIRDLLVSGRSVGDVVLGVTGTAGPLVIEGDRVEGTVTWTGTRDIALTVRDLPVTPGVVVSADLQRTEGVLDISGSAVGEVGGHPTDVAFDAHLDDIWRFSAQGTLAAGSIALDAQRAADLGWGGTVVVGDARFGAESVTIEGTLAGDGLVPTLSADVVAAGPVDSQGTVQASTERVTIEQRIDLPGSAAPLVAAGTVWPSVDVRLSHEDDALQVRAAAWSAPLDASGGIDLTVLRTRIALAGGPLQLRIEPPVADLALAGPIQEEGASLLEIVAGLRGRGVRLQAEGAGSGAATLDLAPLQLVLDAVRIAAPSGLAVAADGTLGLGAGTVTGTVTLPAPGADTTWSGVPFGEPLAFELEGLEGPAYRADIALPTGRASLLVALGASGPTLTLDAEASFAGGTVRADLDIDPVEGARGEIALDDVGIPTVVGAERLAVSGTLRALRNEIDVTLRGSLNGNSAQLAGVWSLADLVPAGLLPEGDGRRRLEVRLRTFDPTTLPVVSRYAPNLDVPLTGVLQIEPGRVFGRLLATELRVLDEALPLTLDVTGSFDDLRVQGELGRSSIQFDVTPDGIEGYVRLERFPAHLAIEALVGETDVSAEITGVLRGNVPLRGGLQPDVRLATERIRLERAGVVTLGDVTVSYLDGALTVERAFFQGEGTYRASGVIRPTELDFSLRAQDADFGPLLGLVPSLASVGADARGDMIVDASGSLRDPSITVALDGLVASVAGGSYQIPTAQVRLRGSQLTTEGTVVATNPIAGRVTVRGEGTLSLSPFRLGRVEIGVNGAATIPALGEVRSLDGQVAFGAGSPPTLDLTGSVGNPLSVSGTLAPLDLTFEGQDLAVTSPTFLIASSVVDLSGSVRQERRDGGPAYVVRGEIFADQARFALGIRPPSEVSARGEPSATLQRVVFDGVRIEAPRQLQLSENFGTLEGRASLVLGGTAASPTLAGTASAVRGNVRFFGREFDLVSARAVFERTRGIFPQIALEAQTTANKAQVLAGIADRVSFVVPREGQTFEIDLVMAGELEPTPGGQRAFRLQIEPELSSPARIEVEGEGDIATGARPLLDTELLSIVTLGRLEINPQLGGEQGIASAVAGTTLDTVVDFLLVSELQRSLSEALGVDVVEIRTSNLSQVFSGDVQDPFSVSLRLGGYLTEDLFASYRIGRFDDASAELGFTNEVRFTYELGPIALDVAGTVGFASIGTGTPIPGVSAAVRYEVSRLIDLETSIDLSNAGNRARFGVTFRW